MPATTYSPTRFRVQHHRPKRGLTSVFGMGISYSGRKQIPAVSLVARASEWQDFCGYPRIAWVIPCHQEGLLRHMYVARLWPTINNGSAQRYTLWTRRSTRI